MFRMLLISCMLFTTGVYAEETCRKIVFDKICLGGDINAAVKATGLKLLGEKGYGKAFGGRIDGYITYMDETDGKVAHVMRIYDNPTILNFSNLSQKLEEKYGPAENADYFPSYSTTPEQRSTSALIGKGEFRRIWNHGDWKIVLLWRGKDMMLTYIDNALHEIYQQRKKASNDL